MESIDYNWVPPTAPQSYQYLGYGTDSSLIPGGVGNDGLVSASSIDHPLDANQFLASSLDYTPFHGPFGGNTNFAPLAATSASPPPQQLSMRPNGSVDSAMALDEGEASCRRSSSEEKDVRPAQSRRKAQNRAAQRAFRERKEKHVRELEAKLNLLTTTTSSLQSDNERLKLMVQRLQTENDILRATTFSSPSSRSHPPGFIDDSQLRPPSHSRRSQPNLAEAHFDATKSARGCPSASSSPTKSGSPGSGSHLLSASDTWDLLQSHPLYLSGALDIGEFCERMKKMARCDGMGPMFQEEEVRQVIEEIGRSGGDELI